MEADKQSLEHRDDPADASIDNTDCQSEDPALIDLPLGKAVSLAEASEWMRSSFHSVILFAGTAHCGKTTLLASLSLLFQKGPFAGYVFAGSRTLVGFEYRNYFALCASKGAEPKTPRTVVSEYLHLRVRRSDLSEPCQDLLLCDMAGEDFREVKDSAEACKQMQIIPRADYFVLLIDGDKLCSDETRQRAKNDPLTLLRNCLDCEALGSQSSVDIVFTKWDKVEASPRKSEITEFASHVRSDFERLFAKRVGHLRFGHIAAHPFKSELPLGYGLEPMFRSWADGPSAANRCVMEQIPPCLASEFDSFPTRVLARKLKTPARSS